MQEIFKDIKGYKGFYQISNLGRVKSLARKDIKGHNLKERILKPMLNTGGYYHVSLYNGNKKCCLIHQLVAECFLNHIPNRMKKVVDHIDCNKINNKLSNLRIVTQRENSDQKNLKSSSKHIGVRWNKERKKWRTRIWINEKNINLGYFSNELKASEAYEKALNHIHVCL